MLEQTCCLSRLSVCLSVCPSGGSFVEKTAARDWIWMPFTVVSGFGQGMGALDWGDEDHRRGRGSFKGKCGASHCNQ